MNVQQASTLGTGKEHRHEAAQASAQTQQIKQHVVSRPPSGLRSISIKYGLACVMGAAYFAIGEQTGCRNRHHQVECVSY